MLRCKKQFCRVKLSSGQTLRLKLLLPLMRANVLVHTKVWKTKHMKNNLLDYEYLPGLAAMSLPGYCIGH
jgi:hypothetical protein